MISQTFGPPVVINSNDGLSQNAIRDILQDKTGFLWFATDNGLNRYDGYSFAVYRNNPRQPNTISCNTITCLFEDSRGILWVGTERGGMNGFDPKTEHFTAFLHDSSNSRSIASNDVRVILEDKQGLLWIGTDGGLDMFDPHTRIFTHDALSGASSEKISSMIMDSDGRLWIGTTGGDIMQYDPREKKGFSYTLVPSGRKRVVHPLISSILEDPFGQLWVGTLGEGLFVFDRRAGAFEQVLPPGNPPQSLVSSFVRSLLCSGRQSLMVLTHRSLEAVDLRDHVARIIWINHIFTSLSVARMDASGTLWMGSLGTGIGKFVPARKHFKAVLKTDSTRSGLSFSSVRAIYEDHDGNLWVGGHVGLNRLASEERKQRTDYLDARWEIVKPLSGENIFSLTEDPVDQHTMWVGSEGGGLFTYNMRDGELRKLSVGTHGQPPAFPGTQGFKCLVTENGTLYWGSEIGLSRWNRNTMEFENCVHNSNDPRSIGPGGVKALCEDTSGRLWIGTDIGGISIFNPSIGTFEHFHAEPGNPRSLSDNKVNAILKDSHGTMWVGTAAGLNKFMAQERRFVVYTMENGLPNDCIYAVQEDKNGNLWLSTNKGISKFDPRTEIFTNYDQRDGLQGNEFNTLAWFKSKSGELFFGGIDGFTSFFPEEIQANPSVPRVVMTDFKKFNQTVVLPIPVRFLDSMTLSNTDYVFSFEFAALEFTDPMKNRYAYKMEGFDEQWRYTTAEQRNATYTNLDPGEYIFRLKASNNDGVWNEADRTLRIIITPPLWATWWFRASGSLIILGAGYGAYRMRMKSLRRQHATKEKFAHQLLESQESERKRIATEMHDAIGQDLLIIKNLSFMAMERKEIGEKNQGLNDISDTASRAIDDVRKIAYNLRPYQIDKLGLTKSLESLLDNIARASEIRFSHDIENIDGLFPKGYEIHIYRMLQECLNNIIKHSNASEAIVTVRKSANSVAVTVNDDGKGFVVRANLTREGVSAGFGLTGLAERTMILGGNLEIASKPGKGTVITIKLPLTGVSHG